jgi:hypothetical protein
MSFKIMQNLYRHSLIRTNKEPNNTLPAYPNMGRYIAKEIINSYYPFGLKVRGQ